MRRRRREWVLDRLSSNLQTSPSQDRVLEEVVDDLMDVMGEERGGFASARSTLADVLRADAFDSKPLDELRDQQDASVGRVQDAVADALAKLHGVLDDEQRQRLARFISEGRRGHRRHRWHGRHLHAA
ncbi:MAG: periplasmic heavy metal sensor [Deltaproteobacteria bacterium]|nr:periplasmic heavy metal sensor [Deltaproteobacteria bacterium]